MYKGNADFLMASYFTSVDDSGTSNFYSVYSYYTFEKRYYVFDPITRFASVCLCVCLSVCVCLCVCVCVYVSVCLSSRLWRDGCTQQHGVK